MRIKYPRIQAANGQATITASGEAVEILAADSESGDKPTTFNMVAYTGAQIHQPAYRHPVVVDVAGIQVSEKARPVFKSHMPSDIVGHTTKITKSNGQLLAEGVISGIGQSASEVLATAKKGFPWQASIGATPKQIQFVDEGVTVQANGQTFKGPLYLVRKSVLKEISFVTLGADDNTMSQVAASSHDTEKEMKFGEWLASLGINAADLSQDILAKYQDMFNKLEASAEGKSEGKPEETKPEVKAEEKAQPSLVDIALADAKYVAEIKAACQDDAELLVKALEARWSVGETKTQKELKDLRSQRPQVGGGVAIHVKDRTKSNDVIEAALCLSMGLSPEDLMSPTEGMSASEKRQVGAHNIKAFDEKTIDSAAEQYPYLGLRDALLLFAQRDGGHNGLWGGGDTAIRASFTSLSLPTVFQAALNRQLLAQYRMAANTWRSFCKVGSVPDFREVTRFRVHGTGAWEKLTPAGELKTGQIEEGDKYYNKAQTIGQMLMLTREDLINDDLGALNGIAQSMSFYGNLAPELEAYKTLIGNSGSFFSVGNKNLITGAGSAFGLQGLTDLWTKFRTRRDKGVSKDAVKPAIDISPRLLLVPVELEIDVINFLGTDKFEVGGSNTGDKVVVKNPFYQRFQVVASPYLSDTGVHASASATAYYLFADPMITPAIEMVFLNGKQRPTIESVEPRPEVLGMGFRGWFDFGCRLQDPLGAAKSAGA